MTGINLEKDVFPIIFEVFSRQPPSDADIFEEKKYASYPFEKARKGHNEAIEAILSDDHKVVFLASPTGTGKTAVYLTAIAEEEVSGMVIVPRNGLQVQLENYKIPDYNIVALLSKEKHCIKKVRHKREIDSEEYEKWQPVLKHLEEVEEGTEIPLCYYKISDTSIYYDGQFFPYPCPLCPYEIRVKTIEKGLKNNENIIAVLNQGNFYRFKKLCQGIVVIDEMDETFRSIKEHISIEGAYNETPEKVLDIIEEKFRSEQKTIQINIDRALLRVYQLLRNLFIIKKENENLEKLFKTMLEALYHITLKALVHFTRDSDKDILNNIKKHIDHIRSLYSEAKSAEDVEKAIELFNKVLVPTFLDLLKLEKTPKILSFFIKELLNYDISSNTKSLIRKINTNMHVLITLRREDDEIIRKLNRVAFFRTHKNKLISYTNKKRRRTFVEIFDEDPIKFATRLFPNAEKIILVSATPPLHINNSSAKIISFNLPFPRSAVLYISYENLSVKNVKDKGEDLLVSTVNDVIIPIYEYVKHITNEKIKVPIHAGNLNCHGKIVVETLKSRGYKALLMEEGEQMKSIETFKNGDYDFIAIVSAEYGFDWVDHPLQFILKMPYIDFGAPRTQAIKKLLGQEKFDEWYCWDAISKTIQAAGRNARDPKSFSLTVILDTCFEREYKKFEEKIPEWFKERLIWVKPSSSLEQTQSSQ